MRNAFAEEVLQLARLDPQLILLSGDIGNRLFDPFKQEFPDRFFNCGVAEANMTGIAAGLAMCGFHPITYTIAAFNTVRCLEQIRDDIAYHQAPVLIVGTGAGLSYASLGCTHHSCEDISLLRSIPNMTVLCPGDPVELRILLRLAIEEKRSAYMRIGKTKDPVMHQTLPSLQIGKGYVMRQGKDLCILSTGNMLAAALDTASLLEKQGLFAEVISVHTVKPLDDDLLKRLSREFSFWVVLEEHSGLGGLGSAIGEWILDTGYSPHRVLRFHTPDQFPHVVGSQAYLRRQYGLEPDQITSKILTELSYAHSSSYSR